MKLELFEIVFDANRVVFASGESIKGEVRMKLSLPMKMRSLSITFEGKGKSHWEVKHGRSRTVYKANEIYIQHTIRVYGSEAGQPVEHPQGFHTYPFNITLAPTLPSSFEGRRGYVRYNCKATIDRPWKFDEHTKRLFTVIKHLDLNQVPAALTPIWGQHEEDVSSCCSSGSVTGTLKVDKTGYVPGEAMAFTVTLSNSSSTDIEKIDLQLRQVSTYTGYSDSLFSSGHPKQHVKIDEFCLYVQNCKIKKNAQETITKDAKIPALPPTGLDGCGIIDIQYVVALKVDIGWSTLEIERGIIIGTVPLRQQVAFSPLPTAPDFPPMPVGSAPPLPQYSDAPPSYEESVFGRTDIRDETDDAHTSGQNSMWAPSYPYYNWNLVGPPAANPQEQPSAPPYETIQRI